MSAEKVAAANRHQDQKPMTTPKPMAVLVGHQVGFRLLELLPIVAVNAKVLK